MIKFNDKGWQELVVSKRIKKEINLINENLKDICKVILFSNNSSLKIFNFLLLNNNKIIDVSILLSKEFPFSPPKVKIEDKNYIYLLQKMSNEMFIEKTKCFCCQTLACESNWKPITKIYELILEINNNFDIYYKFKKREEEIKLLKKILKKKITIEIDDIFNIICYYL